MNALQDRTNDIKRELAELNQYLKVTVQKAIRVGELLTEQKEFIGHGKFLSWLNNNFELSERTARQYMQLFKYKNKTADIADLQTAYKQIESIEAQERMTAEEKKRSLINEFKRTGKRPAGWDRSLDYIIQKEKEEQEKIKVRIETLKKQMQDDAEAKKQSRIEDELFIKHAATLADQLLEKHTQRQEWKTKIRVSNNGKDEPFLDALMDFLETLADDNRRIEACNNIIKICRNISIELQKPK